VTTVVTVVVAASCAALVDARLVVGDNRAAMPGWVAYEREQSYQWIAVARADGSARHNVSPRPRRGERRSDYSPSWSPTGQLAFVRSLPSSDNLMIAELGSWKLRSVSRDPDGAGGPLSDWGRDAPVWSPDERFIAWPASKLFVVDAQRRTRRGVAGEACAPRWSPDGQTLLFLHGSCADYSPQHESVELVRVGGSAHRVIARGSFNSADWSPDGQRIAYAGQCARLPGGDPSCEVFVSDSDGSHLRRLLVPTWSADWVRWTDESTIVAGGFGKVNGTRVGLVAIDLTQGRVRGLAPGVGESPQYPQVTPDGAIAVFTLFARRRNGPALVSVSSGAVTWGRSPIGWGPVAGSSTGGCALCPTCP
jgi:dipeptidyl aminopeptidase/acylaminoacyl peptidase